ncbi:hypothetical protein GCM10009768_21430 [Leucobacter iarius]|uniref:Uncharacterized protein n=1 Tax=Leucobacter iarius TaxID=333963 RepID=A0ABN2LKU7_9MICO
MPAQQRIHLPDTVDAGLLRMQPTNLRDQQLVPRPLHRCRALFRGSVSAGGEEPHLGLPHHTADELDP